MNSLKSLMLLQVLVYLYFKRLVYIPWTNIPATLHIYVPLYFYCSPHIDPTLLYMQVHRNNNLQLLITMLLPYMCDNKYAPQMLHICHKCKLIHVQISYNYVSIYASWTQCNGQCYQEHWYTYNSHYWHMPFNKCACHIVNICSTILPLYYTYRPNITLHNIHMWIHTYIDWHVCIHTSIYRNTNLDEYAYRSACTSQSGSCPKSVLARAAHPFLRALLLGDPNNECVEKCLPKCHQWIAFSRLSYWLNELCPWNT